MVLPFCLTNAPTTFMSLMHGIFQPYLDNFILIFIYNILIYSKNQEERKENLRIVWQTLWENQLYDKYTKCDFFQTLDSILGSCYINKWNSSRPRKDQNH